jgi:hypothetical protein
MAQRLCIINRYLEHEVSFFWQADEQSKERIE